MADIPVVVTAAGPVPTPPAVLRAALIAGVTSTNPGYTANLPGSMIEDMASTDVGALVIIDSAQVETINSLTPFGANDFLLLQLGQIYIGPGAAPAPPSNTSVQVVFTVAARNPDGTPGDPIPGFVIDRGFTVTDGTYQYVVQDGGATASSGISDALFCQSPTVGTWAVAPNTVSQIQTSFPNTVIVTCSNPLAGVSGGPAETSEQFRSRVLQSGQAIATGTATLLKTLLGNVSGVQQRLVSVRQRPGAWEIIVGGGDPYQVAYAIYDSGLDISTLVGSTLSVVGITQANPGVVTTDLNHGYSNGQIAEIAGVVGMVPINGVPLTITVIDQKSFSVGISTLGYPAYESGGVVTPNLRNESPSLNDYPDIYTVPFVNPPQQTVAMTATWSTTAPNFVSQAAVSQLAAPALAAYVNAIVVGAPINILVMESVFLTAIASVLAASQVSALTFAVSINGVPTAPTAGTKLIQGDPESYFQSTTAACTVLQG